MHFAKFGWNLTSGSGEEDENVKSFKTGRQLIRKAHLSLQLRWAKNWFKKKRPLQKGGGGVYVNYNPRLFTIGSAANIYDVAYVIEKILPLLDFIAF